MKICLICVICVPYKHPDKLSFTFYISSKDEETILFGGRRSRHSVWL